MTTTWLGGPPGYDDHPVTTTTQLRRLPYWKKNPKSQFTATTLQKLTYDDCSTKINLQRPPSYDDHPTKKNPKN